MSLSDFDPTKGAKKLNNARKKIFTDPLLDTAESIFKEADRFVESDLGKAVIVGAALYFGYGYLAAQGVGSAAVGVTAQGAATGAATGVAAGEAAVGAEVASAATSTALSAPTAITAGSAIAPASASATVGGTAASSSALATNAATSTLASGAGAVVTPAVTGGIGGTGIGATTAASATTKASLASRLIDSPMAWIVGGNIIGGLAAPDPLEDQKELMRYQEELAEERKKKSNIAGIYGDGSGTRIPGMGYSKSASQRPSLISRAQTDKRKVSRGSY